ncbi:MAG: acyl carrier protein [Acidimicrobiales bacterium]
MTREHVLEAVREAAVGILGAEPTALVEETSFADDLGADSLDLVELVMALEDRLTVVIPEEDLAEVKTVGQAVDLVLVRLGD